jgi:tetratricopeptide (TPR) repeat protein
MDATRHALARERPSICEQALPFLRQAEELERIGNWYLAGEIYRAIAREHADILDPENRARILSRAATAFDVTGQAVAAARAYDEAGGSLFVARRRLRLSGELHNRAARLFLAAGEHFNAGSSWRNAGLAFSMMPEDTVVSPDNLTPVPYSGGKFTVAGACYQAGGDAYTLTGENAKWACMAYWEAGRAYSRQHRGNSAFVAYKLALIAGLKFYGTHNRDELRSYLPLTEEERAAKLDPLDLLEEEVRLGHQGHYQMNRAVYASNWPEIATQRDLRRAFHEFYLAGVATGNGREASVYRAAEKECQRKVFVLEHRWPFAALYWVWRLFAGYGDSLARWVATCGFVLAVFASLYATFNLVDPVSHWFDYIYFSVVTFTSLGYGDLYPSGLWGKIVACAEIVAGLVMFGLLLTFIGNRIQRT